MKVRGKRWSDDGKAMIEPLYHCDWCGREQNGTSELGGEDYEYPPPGWTPLGDYYCPRCKHGHFASEGLR